jgi:hypothetical protein
LLQSFERCAQCPLAMRRDQRERQPHRGPVPRVERVPLDAEGAACLVERKARADDPGQAHGRFTKFHEVLPPLVNLERTLVLRCQIRDPERTSQFLEPSIEQTMDRRAALGQRAQANMHHRVRVLCAERAAGYCHGTRQDDHPDLKARREEQGDERWIDITVALTEVQHHGGFRCILFQDGALGVPIAWQPLDLHARLVSAPRDLVNDARQLLRLAGGIAGDEHVADTVGREDQVAGRGELARAVDLLLGAEDVQQRGMTGAHRVVEREISMWRCSDDEGHPRDEQKAAVRCSRLLENRSQAQSKRSLGLVVRAVLRAFIHDHLAARALLDPAVVGGNVFALDDDVAVRR